MIRVGGRKTRDEIRVWDEEQARTSAASLRLAQGDHPKVVQELLGHSTAAFTMQVYSHLLPGMQEQSAKRLAESLLGASPSGERSQRWLLPSL